MTTAHRLMVVGGAGFVGSNLAERLVLEAHEVEVVDDLSTGSLANLAGARNASGRFKFQNLSVGSAEFTELVSLRRPEIIVNLSVFTPSTVHLEGSLASLRAVTAVLEAARLAGVSKVVTMVPASLLYGEVSARDTPIKEGHLSDPRTSEEVFVRAATDLHTVYRDRHGIEFTVLAVANVYGPRQRPDDGVVAAFADALAVGRAPIVHGTGKQTRDFVHVDDVVDALVRSLDRAGGLVVNVGTGVSTSINELWETMGGASSPVPRTASARPNDLARLALSPTRARIQLGWSPFTPLRDGLSRLH